MHEVHRTIDYVLCLISNVYRIMVPSLFIPLSSCLSVSTLTNLMSGNSSARALKMGPTSCSRNTVKEWGQQRQGIEYAQ